MKRTKCGRPSSLIEALDCLALCEMGKMRAVKEHTSDGPIIVCISVSGLVRKKIHPKYAYILERFMALHGNRDGLFDGCDQTAVVK